eukprot:902268-Prorocentrum_lima.AAC.1
MSAPTVGVGDADGRSTHGTRSIGYINPTRSAMRWCSQATRTGIGQARAGALVQQAASDRRNKLRCRG